MASEHNGEEEMSTGKVTPLTLRKMKEKQDKILFMAVYDYPFRKNSLMSVGLTCCSLAIQLER